MKYLYGAAVQGIQNFIFQTNELKDIVGASELVENICTTLFEDVLGKKLENNPNAIINAAGNIKYEFDENEIEKCKEVFRKFPKTVVEYAPGITISQAVVEMNEGDDFAEAVNKLEEKLRAQRNKPMGSTTIGLMGMMRSRTTGLPVVDHITKKDDDDVKEEKGLFLDAATFNKRYEKDGGERLVKRTTVELCKKGFGLDWHELKGRVPYDIEKITGKNDWIAVIHADGNGLGQIVQKIGHNRDLFKEFSQGLDKATRNAAVTAYNTVHHLFDKDNDIIPIRPIVLGGDDLTVICRADIALEYVKTFIEEFEHETNVILGNIITNANDGEGVFTKGEVRDRLTACAGIAYVKSSYPFYYAYELAEALCGRAKKDAKNSPEVKDGDALPPSCIMFHKVQDSFVQDYESIVKRELTSKDGVKFEFGPYYIHDKDAKDKHKYQVETLLTYQQLLDSDAGNAVKSHLRNWLSLLMDNPGLAKQKLIRLKSLFEKNDELSAMIDDCTNLEKWNNSTSVYDILALHVLLTQDTKSQKFEEE